MDCPLDGPAEIHPDFLDVRLIHSPGFVAGFEVRPCERTRIAHEENSSTYLNAEELTEKLA